MSDESPYADHPYAASDPGNTFSLVAIALGVLGVAACPILFGPAALVLASMALARGERLWPAGVVAAVLGIVGGLVFWIVVYGQVAPFMG